MKRLLICILVIIRLFNAKAQNTFPSSGNAGIGTIYPVVKLEIFDQSDSKPGGSIAPSTPVLKLSRSGTSNYSYNEAADFRISHGRSGVWALN